MKALKKALPIALALGTALVGTTAHAKSISGSVDFRVTLPEVLVLYHWDDAHLTLADIATTTANDSNEGREISDSATRTKLNAHLGETTHDITSDVATPDNKTANGNTVAVTLKNAWGVRALSTGDVKLQVKEQQTKLLSVKEKEAGGAGASYITISGTQIAKGATTVAKDVDLNLPSGWELSTGDIKFNLDLTNAKHVGEYNTRAVAGQATTANEGTDTFLLTLTGN